MTAELPSGTVTFLFTDIEGSTSLLKQLRDRYGDVLAEHQRLLRHSVRLQGTPGRTAFGCAYGWGSIPASQSSAVNATSASAFTVRHASWRPATGVRCSSRSRRGRCWRTTSSTASACAISAN